MPSASEKRKILVQRIRYIALVLFTSLIIVSFVISLAYNPFESQGRNRKKIIKVNGKWFYAGIDTGFGYWYEDQKNRLQKQGVDLADNDIESLFYSESIKNYAKTLSTVDFIQKLGVTPSDFFYQQMSKGLYGSTKPSFGQKEFLETFYTRDIFLGSWGELQNTILLSPSSVALLYQDTKNLTYDIEILFTERTNFVSRFIQKTDLEAFYKEHISNFLDTLIVDMVTITNPNAVTSREKAKEIFSNALQKGWKEAVANLPADAILTNNITLTRQKNPRYFDTLSNLSSGSVLPKIVYENKKYHVVFVRQMPTFEDLSPIAQRKILTAYLEKAYPIIWAAQSNTLNQALATIASNPLSDWKTLLSNVPFFGYVHIPKFTLVDTYSEDEKGNVFPYALTKHHEILDFIASAQAGTKLFEFDGVYLYIRKNGVKRISTPLSLSNLQDFQYYLMTAWEEEWQKAIEKKSHITYAKTK
jgi:hypothetical protein